MSDDFSMGQAMGDTGGGGQPSPEEQNAGAAVAATGSYLEKTAANVKNQADADQVESTYNAKTHTWSLDNVPHDALQTILQNAKQFGHITQIYQQQIERNQQQQEQLRQHPFANALAQIAANVGAASKDPLVRGLGGAAQALNPTMGQLQGQGMELMKGAEGASAGQSRALESMMAHQETAQYHKDQLESKRMDDRGRIERDAGISARRGDFDKDSYVKELIASGESPERAVAAGDRLEKTSQEAAKQRDVAAAQRQKDLDTKEANFQKSLDARSENTDKMIAAAAARADAAAARGEAKDAKKEAKKKDPGPVPRKQLSDLGGADNALDEIEKILKDPANHELMGPYAGRARELGAKMAPGITDPEGKIKGLIGKLGLQTAQAIKATGAGARGFGPQERPYFEKLAEGIHNTPEQNLQILNNWRHFLDQERKGIQAANPDVDWTGKYAPALGKRLGGPTQTETTKYPWEK
jgi:hypothetical protein